MELQEVKKSYKDSKYVLHKTTWFITKNTFQISNQL